MKHSLVGRKKHKKRSIGKKELATQECNNTWLTAKHKTHPSKAKKKKHVQKQCEVGAGVAKPIQMASGENQCGGIEPSSPKDLSQNTGPAT